MAPYIGQPCKRFEDPRLITGQGTFVDDIQLPGMLHAAVLRSPQAHARLLAVDAAAAKALPGVVAVLTAQDLAGAVQDIPPRPTRELDGVSVPGHPILARDTVRYVGQPVAVVVARERYRVQDALALLQVTYEPLPPLPDPQIAARAEAPPLHPSLGSNVAMRVRVGRGDLQAAFAQADCIVRERYEVPRLSAAPLECRGLVAHYEAAVRRLTLWSSTQIPHRVKRYVTQLLADPPEDVRVIAPDVGGGFGQKMEIWPEEIALSYLAMRLGQPIKWSEQRWENFLAYHGRGYSAEVEAAVRRDGTILGLRFRILADIGAYFLNATPGPLVNAAHRVAGPYAIPTMDVECLGVLTTKPPTGPYRGAGGPEGAFFMERTMDLVARTLGLDPADVRRRHFVPPGAFPYATATGLTYDSGQFAAAFEQALALADYARVRRAQRQRGAAEPLLGVGLATVVKASGGQGEMRESHALVRVEPTGQVVIHTEVSPHGQGTATTFAQIAADVLGVRPADIQVRAGDTTLLPAGQGTFASRGMTLGGSSMYLGVQQARQKMARLAAHLLDGQPDDLVFQEGVIAQAQHPERRLAFAEVAAAAYRRALLPPGMEEGLAFPVQFVLAHNPFGFGAHVVVVEIDRDTGALHILRYAAVHDCGRVINPKLLEGQVYGAIAQGLGQALGEQMVYGPDGQPLTASLPAYPLPRAVDTFRLITATRETPSPTNPLQLKGVGELPTVACAAAVVNAALDALSGTAVRHLDAPLTAHKLWQALHQHAPPA